MQTNDLLNVNNNKKHTVMTTVIKIMITTCIPLELKRGHVTALRSKYTHVDFGQPSAIDMETQVNVSHQLRTLLPDLVNK